MSESSDQPEALVLDDAEVSEFINSVELAPISEDEVSALTAALSIPNRTAFVNRGSIQYLHLPEQQKTDSLYWTLFAQLAADAKGNRETHPVDWYNEYVRVLKLIGMRASGRVRKPAGGPHADPSVDATVIRYLKPFLSPGAQGELPKVVRSLNTAANKAPLAIFNKSSGNLSSANFQVSDGTVDRLLNLTIHVATMDFKTNQTIKNLLFWHWTDRNFTFYYSSDTLTLPKDLADRNRQALYNRVIDRVAANIDDIQLAT